MLNQLIRIQIRYVGQFANGCLTDGLVGISDALLTPLCGKHSGSDRRTQQVAQRSDRTLPLRNTCWEWRKPLYTPRYWPVLSIHSHSQLRVYQD